MKVGGLVHNSDANRVNGVVYDGIHRALHLSCERGEFRTIIVWVGDDEDWTSLLWLVEAFEVVDLQVLALHYLMHILHKKCVKSHVPCYIYKIQIHVLNAFNRYFSYCPFRHDTWSGLVP